MSTFISIEFIYQNYIFSILRESDYNFIHFNYFASNYSFSLNFILLSQFHFIFVNYSQKKIYIKRLIKNFINLFYCKNFLLIILSIILIYFIQKDFHASFY